MSKAATTTSDKNSPGSVPSEHYYNYDYASHHIPPLSGDDGETHNPLEEFSKDLSSDNEILLGMGTPSPSERERKHLDALAEEIKAIDEVLEPKQPPATTKPST